MNQRVALASVAIGVIATIAAAALWLPGPQVPVNVVLVVVCTLRKDQVSPYGGDSAVTPGLTELAHDGALFEDAFDAAPWTKAASTALWTGKHAISIGMINDASRRNVNMLPPEETTLAEFLQGAGYFTAGATANPNTSSIFGFDQGFDTYQSGRLFSSRGDHPEGTKVVRSVLEQLDRRPEGKPVFLMAMILDPHEPISVSRAQVNAYRGEGISREIARYRAALRKTDATITELWHGLRKRGFTSENTLRIVVNDHGEGLRWPRHHGKGHGNFTYQSSVAMPWILNGPGVATDHRIGGVASQVDLVPTVLGMLGIGGYEGPGRNWQAQVAGAARTDRPWAMVDTWFRGSSKAAIYTEDRYCQVDFNEDPMAPECFDRTVDPNARNPLPEPKTALVNQLLQWREDGVRQNQAYPYSKTTMLNSDQEQMLEALGYTEGGDGAP